jgi:Putative transposase/Transposase zinc-binding domain
VKTWERERERQQLYSRRKPESTPLYQIISSGHEVLAQSWEDAFQSEYGVLRKEVVKAFESYLNCGILAHGCARASCENKECQHSELIAFSCKTRSLCPSCAAKQSVIFAENLVENVLLPYDHRHCVFTVPKRVRPYFKFNRELMAHLYRTAWESWKELALEQYPTGIPAAVEALHSAGDLLAFHPHIHGLFLSGVIMPDGSFQPIEVDQERLQTLFADKVLLALLKEGLLAEEDIDNMKSWEHSGFNVFVGDLIDSGDQKRQLLAARYLKKCPLSNERLRIIDGSPETILEYSSYKNEQKSLRTFTPLKFLAEIQQHIPDSWEQTTRFLGAYSSRSRGAAKEKILLESSDIDFLPLPEPIQKSSANWARLMKKVFELDPLLCPKCGSQMRIKAFITNPYEIDRITKNLGIPNQRAPPLLKFVLPAAA